MTTIIDGRTRFSDGPVACIKIFKDRYSTEPVFVINGGLILDRTSPGDVIIESRHMTDTDEEHDAAFVARFEACGFTYVGMNPDGFEATCVITEACYYESSSEIPVSAGDCTDCKSPHRYVPFMPPEQKLRTRKYFLRIEFPGVEKSNDK